MRNIDRTEVAANMIAGMVGYKVDGLFGNRLAQGTTGSCLLIRNFNLNYRDEAVQYAIKSATESVGGISGVVAGNWFNNFHDNLIRVDVFGKNYTIRPGETINLPGVKVSIHHKETSN